MEKAEGQWQGEGNYLPNGIRRGSQLGPTFLVVSVILRVQLVASFSVPCRTGNA